MENSIEQYEYFAVKLALKMYETFAKELITALSNTSSIFEKVKFRSTDSQAISYYAGKADAFGEIAERVQKEYSLAMRNLNNLDYNKDDIPEKDINSIERNREVVHCIMETIRQEKNNDTDRIFPEDKYIGSQFGRNVLRKKGYVADLLESYGKEGFHLGRIAQKKFEEELLPINDFKAEDFKQAVLKLQREFIFKPEKFEKELSESVIPPNMRDAIERKENLKHIYTKSRQHKKVKDKVDELYDFNDQ